MRRIRVKIEYEWTFDKKEWQELGDWDDVGATTKVKERLEWDPVSAFYSLRNIQVPTPTKVNVEQIND